MQRRRFGPAHRSDRHLSQRRQDVVVERSPVDPLGVRVTVHRHMRLHVPFRQIGNGERGLRRCRHRVLAPFDAVDDGNRLFARLLDGELAMPAEGNALRSSRAAAGPRAGAVAGSQEDSTQAVRRGQAAAWGVGGIPRPDGPHRFADEARRPSGNCPEEVRPREGGAGGRACRTSPAARGLQEVARPGQDHCVAAQGERTLPIRFTPTPTRARMGANRI